VTVAFRMSAAPLTPLLSRLLGLLWPHRRTRLKVMHYVLIPLTLWFTILDPGDNLPATPDVLRFTSILALIFVTAANLMTWDALFNGMASRPGPKLPPWAKTAHWWMHRLLVVEVALVAFTGLLLGITASRQLWAGGIVPIGVPLSMPELNHAIGVFHRWQFYSLSVLMALHAAFHIWRHYALRDNALRIMAPKRWHKYL
jgi:superoxide oxidase